MRARSERDRVKVQFSEGLKSIDLDLPWEAAEQIAKQLLSKAKEAEEYAFANRLIGDSALLLRAGVPLGLSNHPKILAQARVEAAHDRTLRRAMPGGIKSAQQFGRPTIINHGVKHVLAKDQA